MRKVPVLTLVSLAAVLAFMATPVFALVITNGPAIDDNNRVVGKDGGNIFYNGVVVGAPVQSVVKLGLPAGGGGTTGAGVSGAALQVTIGEVTLAADRTRSSAIKASGANSAAFGGLSATLNADGSYAVTGDAAFAAPYIVSFGAKDATGKAAAQLLAAPAVKVSLAAADNGQAPAGTLAAGVVALNGSDAKFTVAAGQGTLVYANNTVAVGGYATVSFDYNASAGSVTIAAIGFDGGLDGSVVKYMQAAGSNLAVGKTKNIAVSFNSLTGKVLPAIQVTGSGAATVTITNYKVIKAAPATDYALNAKAAYAVTVDGSMTNVNGQGAGPVTAAEGGFKLAGSQGADKLSNVFTVVNDVGGGAVTAECAVKGTGTGTFALVLTDGANTVNSYTAASQLSASDFKTVVASGTLSAKGPAYLVAQAAGFDAVVKGFAIRKIDDAAGSFDANLVN